MSLFPVGELHRETRGLSGGSRGGAVPLLPDNPIYNFRVRRHNASADLIEQPWMLWPTGDHPGQTGLADHVSRVGAAGVLTFTDAVVVLSEDDYRRCVEAGGRWTKDAARTLHYAYEDLCRTAELIRPYPRRELGLKVLGDGSPEMGGVSLGLGIGEFATCLVPGSYVGPQASSATVASVYMAIPGAWKGYRHMADLHDDQIAVVLGNHWLDTAMHPSLREAGLYWLRAASDGRLVHHLNPDLVDQYFLHSHDHTPVATIATRNGDVIAHIAVEQEAGGVQLQVAPADGQERTLSLRERGALLQRVQFRKFMEGYDVHLGTRGELGTEIEEPGATLRVRDRSTVSLVPHVKGVRVEGEELQPGQEVAVEGDTAVDLAGHVFRYIDLTGVSAERWPYVGMIRRPPSASHLSWGDSYKIGRASGCRVVLPDRQANANIHWKPEAADGTTVRDRKREIPKSDFYTDSIMVASEHAEVDLSRDEPMAVCTARHCYTYVRRGPEIIALKPSKSSGSHDTAMRSGDELYVGNCVFEVVFTPADDAAPVPPPPEFEEVSEELEPVDAPLPVTLGLPASTEAPPPMGEVPAPPTRLFESAPIDELLAAPMPNMMRLRQHRPADEELVAVVRRTLQAALANRPGPWRSVVPAQEAVAELLHDRHPERFGRLQFTAVGGTVHVVGRAADEFKAWFESSGARAASERIAASGSLDVEAVEAMARAVRDRIEDR